MDMAATRCDATARLRRAPWFSASRPRERGRRQIATAARRPVLPGDEQQHPAVAPGVADAPREEELVGEGPWVALVRRVHHHEELPGPHRVHLPGPLVHRDHRHGGQLPSGVHQPGPRWRPGTGLRAAQAAPVSNPPPPLGRPPAALNSAPIPPTQHRVGVAPAQGDAPAVWPHQREATRCDLNAAPPGQAGGALVITSTSPRRTNPLSGYVSTKSLGRAQGRLHMPFRPRG